MPFVHQETETLTAHADLGPGMDHEAGPVKRMPRADVVLVFPYKTSARVAWGEALHDEQLRGYSAPTAQQTRKMELWKAKREGVITALSDSGLILMLYYSRDRDEIFVKVAADEMHIRQVAEMKRHKLELKPDYLSAFAEYKNDYVGQRELGYRDRRVVSHLYKAHIDDPDENERKKYPRPGAIFRTVDRIQLVDYIIRSSDHNCAGVDVGQSLHDKEVLHYFPLHENGKLLDLDKDWFKAFAWGSEIDKVRNYFGERIALYFLFMSHFNKWLIFPSIGGCILTVLSILDGTPDNFTAIFVMIGMALWSTFFVHFWRRTAAMHTVKWGTLGVGSMLEPTRPEFFGDSRIDPVTGKIDRYYPFHKRIWKFMFSYLILIVTIVVLLFVVASLFVLRRIFHDKPGGRLMFQFINAIVVEILNFAFTSTARFLTDRENHRTEADYSNHLLAKTVVFKFVNCYISLYYIAFFKEKSALFGVPMKCVDHDCMKDLGTQLAMFMIVRLTLQNFIELGAPYLYMIWRSYQEGIQFHTNPFTNPLTVMPDLSSAEKQSKKEDYDLFQDMDEILILYGYTSLFVVACPWVPVLALVSCVLECFLDQKKLVLIHRRPFPMPAANNEPWDTAFDVFGILAMMTNLAVVIFASDFFSHWTHASRIILFLFIEHIMIGARIAVAVMLPSSPQEVRMLQLQQRVMVHRHLNLGGEEDDHETRTAAMRTTMAPAPHVFDRDQDTEDM